MSTASPLGRPWNSYGTSNVFGAMMLTWDWESWIKPQIDDLVSLGGNAVRLWGDTAVVALNGKLSLDTYLARWKQQLDYCQSLGLYVYACGGAAAHITLADTAPMYQEWVSLLATYPNVIGVDLLNEPWGYADYGGGDYSATVQLVQGLADIVHGCGLPVGTGFPGTPTRPNWDTKLPPVAPFFEVADVIDWHCYSTDVTADFIAATLEEPWAQGKPMVFGETGLSKVATTDPAAADWYRTVGSLISSNNRMLGAFAWSVYNVAVPSNALGLFSAPGVPITNITKPFETWPTKR
ncbi:glycoside hydrolase family 5 protein [Mycolicibacterium sphagni]|uniref:glycoside hydrolase family 5 protein n=1 Tax=Mycolicibacterium sphagni TaxID=1786 RepID=UPI0021F31FAD|nr:glycoside hydrolase family 5 protein [Mycolicibacterium sphagni]MCV7177495.1 hypothetical protein [Mycolicibacterium sphagni]